MNLLDFWPRKPKALPDELAEQMMMQIGAVSEQLAQQHVDQPDMREAARQVLYPLAASMPGFDWSVMYRYELDRLRTVRDEDDISTLLMVI